MKPGVLENEAGYHASLSLTTVLFSIFALFSLVKFKGAASRLGFRVAHRQAEVVLVFVVNGVGKVLVAGLR